MRLLLDTNAFIRWTSSEPMPKPVERAMGRHGAELIVSIVSALELAIKGMPGLEPNVVKSVIARMGATLLPITFEHLHELSKMPLFINHRDPFDRLLIAQALSENIPIISSDQRFPQYRGLRVIWD